MSDTLTVTVPTDVLEGINAVRESGRVNMIHRQDVLRELDDLGYYVAFCWVNDHAELYGQGFFHGFIPETST